MRWHARRQMPRVSTLVSPMHRLEPVIIDILGRRAQSSGGLGQSAGSAILSTTEKRYETWKTGDRASGLNTPITKVAAAV